MDNHMGLETLIPWIQRQDTSVLEKIVLVHLSDSNSNAQKMKEAVQEAVGVDTITAEAGQVIELSSIGF
jgi:phosphoribosyl 1,2-cyclic phosphodiesterase